MKIHIKKPSEFKVSACTITKNEEKTIAKSIESYKKYVDEIIIADTGSTDDTVKIAESLGAKVLHYEWNDDFAAAKNFAIDASSGDWILCIDSDEYFSGDSCRNIKFAIEQAEMQGKNAVGCRENNIDTYTGDQIAETLALRIFKKGTRYRYPIHEEIYNPAGINVLTVDKDVFYFLHTGYSSEIIDKKCRRNLDIIFKELEKTEDKERKTVYYSYISDAYYGARDYDKSIEYAKLYLKKARENGLRILGCEVKPYLNIIHGLMEKKADFSEIDPYIKEFEKTFPDCPDAVYHGAESLFNMHLYKKAFQKFKNALEMSENYNGVYVNSVAKSKALVYNYFGMCRESELDVPAALEWYFKAASEPCLYEKPIFNLFRNVKNLPEKEVDDFAQSLYLGADEKKHKAVMSALMSNYMSEQLLKCYADYRSKKKEDAVYSDVTAYILAGRGDFAKASSLFLLNSKANQNEDAAMRALVCAVFSNEKEHISAAASAARPECAFALGLCSKPLLSHGSIGLIAGVFKECERLGKTDYAEKRIESLANDLDGGQMYKLSGYLEAGFALKTALAAAQHSDINKSSAFAQGRILYKMRRFNEASDLLRLAKHMGCKDEALEEILGAAQKFRGTGAKMTDAQCRNLKLLIESDIRCGNYETAAKSILKYKQSAEPDEEISAAESALLFYCGNYKKAAVAAEAGLLKNENNFDLLYNAGCIYEKLGDLKRAKEIFERALKNCGDEGTASEIRNFLSQINEHFGK